MKRNKISRYGGLKKGDFDLLFKLSSLREALCISVCDPIVFPSGIEGSGRGEFSHMFYDAVEDEGRALDLMQERIKTSSRDIFRHLDIYKELRDSFYSIDEALNISHRRLVVQHSRAIYKCLVNIGVLVDAHMEGLGEDAFLDYPACLSGDYFMIQGVKHSVALSKIFNLSQDREGFLEELELGRAIVESFSHKQRALPSLSISDALDSGDGVHDTSLRGRLEVTKLLLRRAGMNVPID